MTLSQEQYESKIADLNETIVVLLAHTRRQDKTAFAKMFSKTVSERNELDRQLADQRAINDTLHKELLKYKKLTEHFTVHTPTSNP